MIRSWRRVITIAALLVGVFLLTAMVRQVDVRSLGQLSSLFGIGLPLALLPGAGWHLARTEAWRQCFPADRRVPFTTLFRIRLAAEAFSYVTIAGVTGEPLKVVLLTPAISPAVSAAATALERAVYLVVTAAVVAVVAALTVWMQPLTPRWAHVYEWIAAVAAVAVIVPVVLVYRTRGTKRRQTREAATPSPSRVRRFLHEFASQFRALATGDRRQLGIIVALESAAFLAMALEAFAALSLTGTSVTLLAAIAIETFTRVASMVSSVIPGNIGAMEMSNVAAAAAVHAAGGGVALALLRRVRGLAWCAAGFLVYPRGRRGDRGARDGATAQDPDRTLVAIQHYDSDAMVTQRLGGMPVGERLARAAVRAGYTRLLVWTSRSREREWQAAVPRIADRLHVVATSDRDLWRRELTTVDPTSRLTVLAPGVIASPPLLAAARAVIGRDQPLLEVAAGAGYRESGVFRVAARDLTAADHLAPRLMRASRRGPSARDVVNGSAHLTMSVMTREHLAAAERTLRASIFKPTDGKFGRFNRRLSIPISIALIRSLRLSANAMSVFVAALGLYSGWLFSRGSYVEGILAALISWAASALDGCDGELARLQFKESAFGCWVDTMGDYLYYLAIFAGMTIGAVRQTGWHAMWWCGAALCAGALLTIALLTLLRERTTGGHPERLRTRTKAHFYGTGKAWARVVAKLSSCATRAMMPYGILAFALLGLLPVLVILATIGAQVYWISLALEFRRLMSDRPSLGSRDASIAAASIERHA